MEVMALDVAIRAPGGPETVKTLAGIEVTGKKAAAGLSQSFTKASQEIIDSIMQSGSASAKAHLQMQLSATKASAATVATTQLRSAKVIVAEANLAAHFERMRLREIGAAERAARAQEAAYQRQSMAAQRSAQRTEIANTRTANTMTKRYGTAALGIAGSLQAIAFSGDLSAGALKNILTQGGLLAASMGPQGQLVAAAAVGLSAIVTLFTRARDEAKKMREAFETDLNKMVDTGDRAGIMARAAALYKGTPSQHFNDALSAMAREVKRLEPKNALEATGRALSGDPAIGKQFQTLRLNPTEPGELGKVVKTLDDLKKKLRESREEYAHFMRQLNDPRMPFRPFDRAAIDITGHPVPILGGASFGREQRGPGSVSMEEIRRSRRFRQAVLLPGQTEFQTTAGSTALSSSGKFTAAGTGVARNMEKLAEIDVMKMGTPLMQGLAELDATLTDQILSISDHLGNALQEGFSRAFSGEGLGGLIKGFGAGILGGLGDMFSQMGKHLIKFGITMELVKKGLMNPFTSGPAAIAAGVALVALGAAMGALGAKVGGAGGGSGGGGYAASAPVGQRIADSTTTYRYSPQSMDMTKVNPTQPIHFTIIGTKDIQAQNDIADMVIAAQRRGRG